MTVKELRELLNNMPEHYDNNTVCVEVFRKGAVGGTPCVGIRSVHNGFDWNNHKCIIHTDRDITEISKEDKRDINIDSILD